MMSFSSLSYASTLECSVRTLRSAGLAWNAIFAWVPSQNGLLLEPPHLHKAVNTLPSRYTMFGPFSVDLISTVCMIKMIQWILFKQGKVCLTSSE